MSIYDKYVKIDEIRKDGFVIKSESKLSEFENDLNFPTGDDFQTVKDKIEGIYEEKELENYVNNLIDAKLGPIDTSLQNILGDE